MKTKFGRVIACCTMTGMAVLLLCLSPVKAQELRDSQTGKKHPDEVMKAYNLRMSGKIDEAKALLENIIREDSTNAMAHYEMARLKHYMLIGGGNAGINDIMASSNKAVTYDPENPVYAYYRAIACFMDAFMSMGGNPEAGKNKINAASEAFEKVTELNPDYCEPVLYLVDIYGVLPKEMGGDSVKAVEYERKLEKMNNYFAAKAKAALLPENSDQVAYWKSLLDAGNRSPDILMEIGRAYLYSDNPSDAEQYFNEAIKADPEKNVLILDLARYHILKVMQKQELAANELPVAKKLVEKYLSCDPQPVLPLKAYSLGLMGMIENVLGNKEESEKLVAQATSLDPYFSKISGIPTLMLFDPPDKVTHKYFSFFKPF